MLNSLRLKRYKLTIVEGDKMMYVDKKEFEDKPIDKIVGQTMEVITGRITKKYEFLVIMFQKILDITSI